MNLILLFLIQCIQHGISFQLLPPTRSNALIPRSDALIPPKLRIWQHQRILLGATRPRVHDEEKDRSKGDEVDERESIEEWLQANSELVPNDNEDEEWDWLPDREKARMIREEQRERQQRVSVTDFLNERNRYMQEEKDRLAAQAERDSKSETEPDDEYEDYEDDFEKRFAQQTPYTEEEEELIALMGGKKKRKLESSKRVPGYLGDSTLKDIATDYSVPVCYLADVLCEWGVAPPINVYDRLGDLVTGEQAFAVLEAINTLDISTLHDRYSDNSLVQICDVHDIRLKDGFEMALREGWSVPFGINTCLRVEQEAELLRVLSTYVDDEDDDDIDYGGGYY